MPLMSNMTVHSSARNARNRFMKIIKLVCKISDIGMPCIFVLWVTFGVRLVNLRVQSRKENSADL